MHISAFTFHPVGLVREPKKSLIKFSVSRNFAFIHFSPNCKYYVTRILVHYFSEVNRVTAAFLVYNRKTLLDYLNQFYDFLLPRSTHDCSRLRGGKPALRIVRVDHGVEMPHGAFAKRAPIQALRRAVCRGRLWCSAVATLQD